MSALPPKADIRQRIEHVCFVPIADIRDERFRVANPYAALIGGVELMNRCKSSVCLDVPVFSWMCCRWVLVVVSPIPRSSAASLTLRPGAMASSVRSSLPVRP